MREAMHKLMEQFEREHEDKENYLRRIKGQKCKNCGHERQHHASSGGLCFCSAMISRYPVEIFCSCKKFEGEP